MPLKLSELSPRRLPFLSNKEFEAVEALARSSNINLKVCPTCRSRYTELAPGIWHWPPSTYKLEDQKYDCNCEWQDRLRWHYVSAGIPQGYWTLSEDDFFGDPDALASAQEYLDNWENWKWHGIGLAFHSTNQGTGKTMLATIIARHMIHRGEKVLFTSFYDAVRTFNKPYEQREEAESLLRNTPILVLDEIGPGLSAAQQELFGGELENLIRFRTSGNNITILTTNLTIEDLDEAYPRTFSLLSSKQRHIQVKGHDVRRAGDVDLWNMELIANGEAKPIV